MAKTIIKERPIGTVFEWHGQQIKVVEDSYNKSCSHCCFDERCNPGFYCKKIYFKGRTMCSKDLRKDNKMIHYEKF